MKPKNENLYKAKRAKNDEFYTLYKDIVNELQHYSHHFKDKVVICPCDDWTKSNFYKFFKYNFDKLGLKKLIITGLNAEIRIVEQDNEYSIPLQGNGDFRTDEVQQLIKQSDIVVTNPPFSLFRDFIKILIENDKGFIVLGNLNALTYRSVFPLIRDGRIHTGHCFNKTVEFIVPDDYDCSRVQDDVRYGKVPSITWFSGYTIDKEPFDSGVTYEQGLTNGWYQRYCYYDAININKVSQIPMDYDGVIGVPITFIDKYNPQQFEILNANDYRKSDEVPLKPHGLIQDKEGLLDNGKVTYARVLIRKK